ncbi:MAG: hypothetical protein RLZZ383_1611 [Pseudomonadota bacterium]|jgi:fumarylacetoacetate (FAA) hydrolase
MKLATIDNGTRDGALVVVSKDLARFEAVTAIAPNLQAALDNWEVAAPALNAVYAGLQADPKRGVPAASATMRNVLPRAYEWVDGSAYLNHVILVRKARNAEPPATLRTDPLVYQGGSGVLLDPTAPIVCKNPEYGHDFEAEVAVILGDTPQGTTVEQAGSCIRLVTLVNDITLRNLIPDELAKGFGFFQSKPASVFGPVAVTPDELGDAWREGRLHLPMNVWWNGDHVGRANAGPEMHFGFHELIAHLCKTRAYTAGTVLGSGTVSNEDPAAGYSCIAEIRMREIIATGKPQTRFLQPGDHVRIEVLDAEGASVFGAIDQAVTG